VLLLAALGFAITYGLIGVINMAHGEFLMIGAYATYVVQNLVKHYAPGCIQLVSVVRGTGVIRGRCRGRDSCSNASC
jgi:branched-subunit amino acid ABC-type transport system permease component